MQTNSKLLFIFLGSFLQASNKLEIESRGDYVTLKSDGYAIEIPEAYKGKLLKNSDGSRSWYLGFNKEENKFRLYNFYRFFIMKNGIVSDKEKCLLSSMPPNYKVVVRDWGEGLPLIKDVNNLQILLHLCEYPDELKNFYQKEKKDYLRDFYGDEKYCGEILPLENLRYVLTLSYIAFLNKVDFSEAGNKKEEYERKWKSNLDKFRTQLKDHFKFFAKKIGKDPNEILEHVFLCITFNLFRPTDFLFENSKVSKEDKQKIFNISDLSSKSKCFIEKVVALNHTEELKSILTKYLDENQKQELEDLRTSLLTPNKASEKGDDIINQNNSNTDSGNDIEALDQLQPKKDNIKDPLLNNPKEVPNVIFANNEGADSNDQAEPEEVINDASKNKTNQGTEKIEQSGTGGFFTVWILSLIQNLVSGFMRLFKNIFSFPKSIFARLFN